MFSKIPLIVIAGPTGIGKSSLATELAQILNTDIISADSRQIYRNFDIDTAKPTISEQKLLTHHLIDLFRIIIVLEVYESTGQKFSTLCKRTKESIYNLIYIGLDLEREKLYQRIGYRVEKMIEDGLVDEVSGLIKKYGKELKLLN